MKKFYYKKDRSVDKNSIVQPLERRHTLDIDKNGKEHDQSRVTTRTKSFSSVHLLQEDSATSTAKVREITKSLSEDVLSKSHLRKSAKVITETDLALSGLYKARKASMNSKDTPQKIPQPTGLSPVALTDPKLKPVPVTSRARSKSTTCLCYFAIMMAISLCTIGVLATVTGILYNEIISSEDLTSAESSESKTDYSNLIPEFRLLNDNYSETNEFNFNNETAQLSLESTDNISFVSENETFTLHEDRSKENVQIMGVGQLMDVNDLSQLLDSQKAGIKFKDGDTIIYELNSNKSSEFARIANNLQMEELDSNENKTEIKEPSTSKDINTWPAKVINEKIKELENLEVFIDPQSKLKAIFTDNDKDQHLLDENPNINGLKDFVDYSSNFTFENESILGSSLEQNKSELFDSEESQSLPKSNVGDVYNQDESIIQDRSDGKEEIFESNDLNNFTLDERESEPEMYEVETFPVLKNTDMNILTGKSEHVDSMLMTINEDEASNTVLNRNGEINPLFENSSLFETKYSVNNQTSLLTTQRSQGQQMSTQEAQHMKPMDMKVSLAEAMKHLQVLDVNNTFLTSRMRSTKPKPQNTGRTKLAENSQNKQNITIENMKYLQNLRLLLQKNMLRS